VFKIPVLGELVTAQMVNEFWAPGHADRYLIGFLAPG
jgi:hypothetical protein